MKWELTVDKSMNQTRSKNENMNCFVNCAVCDHKHDKFSEKLVVSSPFRDQVMWPEQRGNQEKIAQSRDRREPRRSVYVYIKETIDWLKNVGVTTEQRVLIAIITNNRKKIYVIKKIPSGGDNVQAINIPWSSCKRYTKGSVVLSRHRIYSEHVETATYNRL